MKQLYIMFFLVLTFGCDEKKIKTTDETGYVYSGELIPFYRNNSYGYSDTLGEEIIIDNQYESADFFKNDCAKVQVGEFSYLINRNGEIISDKYEEIYDLSYGLRRVKKNDMYGYINEKGKVVIPLDFTHAYDFSDSLAYVYKEDLNGFINQKGMEHLPLKYDTNYPFYAQQKITNKICKIENDGKIGFMKTNNSICVDPQYEDATNMSSDRALCMLDLKYSLINNSGEKMTSSTFDFGLEYYNNLCPVRIGNDWFLIDEMGNRQFSENYDIILNSDNNENYTVSKNEKWGLINKYGSVLIDLKYQFIESLGKDLYGYKLKNKWGLISIHNKTITDPDFENVRFGKANYVFVKHNGQWIVSNNQGKLFAENN